MIIDAVSDLHGFHPELERGDMLIIAGDLTAKDEPEEHADFAEWLDVQPYRMKIVIAGNHDNHIDADLIGCLRNCYYLQDSDIELEGLKIWGSPYSLWFHGVNPRCKAFMGTESDLKKKYDAIPDDIDILITHTPPYGVLDEGYGSKSLLETLDRVKPKIHIFGHIHEQGAKSMLYKHIGSNTTCYNVSIVNRRYQHVNPVTRIIL